MSGLDKAISAAGGKRRLALALNIKPSPAVTFTLGITSRLERVFYLRCQRVDQATIPCLIRLTGMNWWRSCQSSPLSRPFFKHTAPSVINGGGDYENA